MVLFFLWVGMNASAEARDDWEYWNEFEFKKALQEKIDFRFTNEARFQDDLGNFYQTEPQITLLWKPRKFIEIGPGYRYSYTETSTGKNTDDHRVLLETTLKGAVAKWGISNRHRVEYRNLTDKEFWGWRGRLRVSHPVKVGKWEVSPFVSDELFWDTRREEFNQNRFSLGFSKSLSKTVGLDIYYMLRSQRTGGDWNESNVFGTGLKISY